MLRAAEARSLPPAEALLATAVPRSPCMYPRGPIFPCWQRARACELRPSVDYYVTRCWRQLCALVEAKQLGDAYSRGAQAHMGGRVSADLPAWAL